MATQSLKSLLGSRDEREQVSLGLSPIALTPTIRAGGNYRVAVAATPKTNAALQLSQALKKAPGFYSKAVEFNQERAAEAVATMSPEDFEKEIQNGLDKDGRSLFGYTKAYNEALTQKYYSEEMPKKFQDISAELFKDPYAYKDTEAFEQAATAAVDAAYDEASELLSDNPFSARAHNILRNKTRETFINDQRAKYITKLPEITRQIQTDSSFKQFNNIEDFTQTKSTIEGALLSASSKLGNRDAAAIVTKSYFSEVERAIMDGEFERAEMLLGELDDEQNGEGRRKFNGQEIFNTASNRIKIEDLETKLELKQNEDIDQARKTALRLQSDINLYVQKAIGVDEKEQGGMDALTVLENEITQSGTMTLNGKTEDNPLVVSSALDYIRAQKKNPDLFKGRLARQFIQTNSQPYIRATNGLITRQAIQTFGGEEAADILYTQEVDVFSATPKFIPTPEGTKFLTDYEAERYKLADDLYSSIKHLPVGEREVEFNRRYSDEIVPALTKYRDDFLESLIGKRDDDVEARQERFLSDAQIQGLKNNGYTYNQIEEIEKEKERLSFLRPDVFDIDDEGVRHLNTSADAAFRGVFTSLASYNKANNENLWKDEDEKRRGLNTILSRYHTRIGEEEFRSPKKQIYAAYSRKPLFSNLSVLQKIERKKDLVQTLEIFGLTSEELINGTLDFGQTHLVTDVFSGTPDFATFPIIFDAKIDNIIKVVSDYSEGAEPPRFISQIADEYGVSVEDIIDGQREYLLKNNFITNE